MNIFKRKPKEEKKYRYENKVTIEHHFDSGRVLNGVYKIDKRLLESEREKAKSKILKDFMKSKKMKSKYFQHGNGLFLTKHLIAIVVHIHESKYEVKNEKLDSNKTS